MMFVLMRLMAMKYDYWIIWYIISTRIILSSMQNGFPHTVYILWAFTLALTHVDIRYHLLPASLHVQTRYLLLINRLFTQVVLYPLALLLLFIPQKLLQNPSPLLSLPIFLFPLFFLDKLMVTLLDFKSC